MYYCNHCGWVGDTPVVAGHATHWYACPVCGWAVNHNSKDG